MLEQLKEEYGDEMSFVYRHFPLKSIHDKAVLASEAAEAAGEQDAFWEYHQVLYANFDEWAGLSQEEAIKKFIDYAKAVNLDVDQFTEALNEGRYTQKIEDAYQAAAEAGLGGTPTIFVNGYLFPSQQLPMNKEGIDLFLNIIRLMENQYDAPKQVLDLSKKYQATVSTEKGDIVFDLFADTAPVNANSFAFLAEKGWYDDGSFHRVLPDFMAQGGDPTGIGVGWPGYRCGDEVTSERDFSEAGMVAMANSGPNTNGAQFFITYGPTPHLNEGFTIIGQVVSGQDVVESLTPRNPEQQPDFAGDKILSVTVTEKK